MKIIAKFKRIFVIALVFVIQPAWAVFEWSPFRTGFRVQSDVNSGGIILTKPGGWGAAHCPTAPYVQIFRGSGDFSKEILAHVMSAKVSAIPIRVYGECNGVFFQVIAVDW